MQTQKRFSARYQNEKGDQKLIIEDVPRATRIGYIKGILGGFVGDKKTRFGINSSPEPLDIFEIHEKFVALIRDESDPWDYDNQSSWTALVEHLKSCSWLEFYDFVELLGKQLLKLDDDPFLSETKSHFKNYQAQSNALFSEDGIGWSLNDISVLKRQIPMSLENRISATEKLLKDGFESARGHFKKAQNFIYSHPIDEANCIKEVVSALESVVRVIEPSCTTLGDAIKTFKKKNNHPKHLIDAIEKLYLYSNATPTVRHGHPEIGVVSVMEAELALHIGIAYIRYFISTNSQINQTK